MVLAESMRGKTTQTKNKHTTTTTTILSSIERRLSESARGQAGLYCFYVVQF